MVTGLIIYFAISITFTCYVMKGDDISTPTKREAAAVMGFTFLLFGPVFLVILMGERALYKASILKVRG